MNGGLVTFYGRGCVTSSIALLGNLWNARRRERARGEGRRFVLSRPNEQTYNGGGGQGATIFVFTGLGFGFNFNFVRLVRLFVCYLLREGFARWGYGGYAWAPATSGVTYVVCIGMCA